MATERQIAANRLKASKSCGPKSPEGKARSRANATRHGLAGQLPEVEVESSPEFLERREEWAVRVPLPDPAAHWAMDRAVAATFRIERCERAFEGVILASRERAHLAWAEDREIEAGVLFARLGRDPVLASRQLRASLAGVGLLIEAWLGLIAALEGASNWSEAEASRALDLLGVSADLRNGRTEIDPFDETDPIAFRRDLAFEEIERLEASRDEAMTPLDEMDRRRALQGDVAMLSKPARLVLRYERDAWRRYNQAMLEVRGGAGAVEPALRPAGPSSSTPSTPSGRPTEEARKPLEVEARSTGLAPQSNPRPGGEGAGKVGTIAPPAPRFEEQRRALRAEAAPFVNVVTDRLRAEGFVDEDAMIEELERRVAAGPAGYRATERSQFGGGPIDRRVMEG